MKRTKKLDIVFILDKSGSMYHLTDDTIGGYNDYIKEYKDKNARVTTVLFDTYVKTLYVDKDIKEVSELTTKEYMCGGSTALLDAIGLTIDELDKKNKHNVLFVITTDGMENASREYKKEDIKKKIKDHKDFEFIFIGADLNSFEDARSWGIKDSNMVDFETSSAGVANMFKKVKCASKMMYDCACLPEDWNK